MAGETFVWNSAAAPAVFFWIHVSFDFVFCFFSAAAVGKICRVDSRQLVG